MKKVSEPKTGDKTTESHQSTNLRIPWNNREPGQTPPQPLSNVPEKRHKHSKDRSGKDKSRSKDKKGKRSRKGDNKQRKRNKKKKRKRRGPRSAFSEFHFDESIAFKHDIIDIYAERRRHRKKRLKLVQAKMRRRLKLIKERKKVIFFMRWYHWLKSEHFGPSIYRVRSAVFQRYLYLLNALQGLAAFIIVLYFSITHPYNVPSVFALPGLYVFIFFANWLDVFGSIFGFLIAVILGRTRLFYNDKKIRLKRRKKHEGKKSKIKRKKKKSKGKGKKAKLEAKTTQKTETIIKNGETNLENSKAETALESASSNASFTNDNRSEMHKVNLLNLSTKNTKEEISKIYKLAPKSFENTSELSKGRVNKTSSKISDNDQSKKVRMGLTEERPLVKKTPKDPSKSPKKEKKKKKSGSKKKRKHSKRKTKKRKAHKKKIKRRRLSVVFINRIGYTSYIMLQAAWFLNIFFTAYYHWRSQFVSAFRTVRERCKIDPKPSYCSDFDSVYLFLLLVVGITFILRNILVFFIGMCFNEAVFRRYKEPDPNFIAHASDSESQVDYTHVPKPLLVPFNTEKPWTPVWPTASKFNKVKAKSLRKRVLNARERQTEKILDAFKDIRRAKVITGKKRADVKIRRVEGALDTMQMPAELMTAKARAWLSGEETDSSQVDKAYYIHSKSQIETLLHDHRRHKRRRHGTKRKVKKRKEDEDSSDSNSIFVVHDHKSKIKQPISELIKPKLQDLSDRISTDESWSGRSVSLFETASESSSELDEKQKERKESDEDYFALMKLFDATEIQDDDYI